MNHAQCITREGRPLLFKGLTANGRVVGRMLEMTLEQTYFNPDKQNVEVVYTFPLPHGAVLLGIEAVLNGETLHGKVTAKAAARETYETALTEGNTALLLSVQPNGTHTLELGNLLSKETAVVKLTYVQVLKPEQGSLRLTLPTTLAPRYGDPIGQGKYDPHAVPQTSTSVEYPFDLVMRIEGELAMARIGSPSHPIQLQLLPAIGAGQTLAQEVRLGRSAWLDRDFILKLENLLHPSQGLASWDRLEEGVAVVMASFTPTWPHAASSPIALKVLVDCSGSMAGDSIQAARQALHRVLGGLEANDRFSLSRFGSHVEHRCKALWKVLPRTQAAARLWVEQLDADLGGTEMATALASTLALSGGGRADTRANTQPNAQLNARPDARADVLLVTDGEVEAIDEVIGTAQASGQRMFVVGIGSSAAETLLRRLAEETGGSCEFVAPGEEVEPAILRLYHRMRSSVVTQVSITWPEGLEPMAQTEIPKAIFHGDSINVYARLKAGRADALCQPIALLGSGMGVGLDEGVVRPLAEVRPAFIADEANTLARLAAHTRYTQLRRSADAAPAFLTKALPGLAEKYQLVTDDTSFVLVKERDAAEQPADLPALRQVPHMLAAGWGGQGSVVASKSMSVPSVWRSQRTTASAVHYLRRSMLDDFEIPAFLRRSADVDDMDGDMSFDAPATIKEPQRSTSNWVDTATGASRSGVSCPGWTPAGYAQWLRMNPGQWPETYAALRTMGLGEWVVQWLEFVIADIADMDGVDTQVGLPVPGENEQTVVLAFNQVMADRGRSFLSELGDKFASVIGKDQKTLVDSPLPELDGLRGRIQAALLGMVPGAWPDAVLHFGEDVDA